MPDKSELAGEKVFEGDELFVLLDDGVGGLFPRQADVGAETHFQSGAFVAGLHDAGAGAGDDHEARVGNLAGELDRFEIFLARGQSAGGAEDGDFAGLIVGGEKTEGVAQFAHGGADDPHVAAILDVCQQFEGIDNDFLDQIRIIAPALGRNQFLNAAS